jgi:NADPH-dependent 2,4-dienoyl-CoA reductase/sulfur reductase-like enzyme
MMERVAVVGAGIAGLAVAAELADARTVTVIDRLPAVGGESGYEHPVVRTLQEVCNRAGVTFVLGTTALRWSRSRLLVAAPNSIRWLDADRLVFAGGCRPGTSAELRLAGSRLAGVVSATVAIHLLDAGVRLGRNPVLLGESDFASEVAGRLQRARTPVRLVAPDATAKPAYADAWWPGWRGSSVRGTGRVRELEIACGDRREWLACDAVILADGIRPLRNVDGALADPDPATFVQLPGPHVTIDEVVAFARAAAVTLKSAPWSGVAA